MSNTSSADALRGSTQTRAAPAAWFCRCWRSLRLKEHRAGSASRDATGVAVQRLAEARGAERDRAQQDMFADSHPRDVGDAARRTASQLEQAEVRGTAANIAIRTCRGLALCAPGPSHSGLAKLCCSSQQ
jgi:hypothetical protein